MLRIKKTVVAKTRTPKLNWSKVGGRRFSSIISSAVGKQMGNYQVNNYVRIPIINLKTA